MKTKNIILKLIPALLLGALPNVVMASEQMASQATQHMDLTNHWIGFLSIGLFVLAYFFVMAEEFTHLRKSKPVILAA
ncbi:MAG: sodium:proton antiporter, partial [Gammaproteobacteria bacterium]